MDAEKKKKARRNGTDHACMHAENNVQEMLAMLCFVAPLASAPAGGDSREQTNGG